MLSSSLRHSKTHRAKVVRTNAAVRQNSLPTIVWRGNQLSREQIDALCKAKPGEIVSVG